MLFNSYIFVVLVTVTFFIYYHPKVSRVQVLVLIVSSLFFYGYHQPWLLMLLLLSGSINAVASYDIYHSNSIKHKKIIALLGVVFNLSVLGAFKYNGMLADWIFDDIHSLNGIMEVLVFLPLPVGISFYTFQGISLVVDVYSQSKGERHDWHIDIPRSFRTHYVNTIFFITFFPQLVAGPIVKAHDFLPQIGYKALKDINWSHSFRMLILGYFLKMVIADNLKDQTFWIAMYDFQSTLTLLTIIFGYSIQIFADFAGYSLIAIGVASLFGYRLPDNFNFPYISRSFSEFWKRWHMTLGLWLKEYLYIPLGGNRKGELRNYLNLLIVMTLGGLWHGASLNFVAWGVFHGSLLMAERFFSHYIKLPQHAMVTFLQVSAVFTLVSFGWLFFQLDMGGFLGFFNALLNNTSVNHNRGILIMIFFYTMPVILYYMNYLLYDKHSWYSNFIDHYSYVFYGAMIFAIIFQSGSTGAFIYFQF